MTCLFHADKRLVNYRSRIRESVRQKTYDETGQLRLECFSITPDVLRRLI